MHMPCLVYYSDKRIARFPRPIESGHRRGSGMNEQMGCLEQQRGEHRTSIEMEIPQRWQCEEVSL